MAIFVLSLVVFTSIITAVFVYYNNDYIDFITTKYVNYGNKLIESNNENKKLKNKIDSLKYKLVIEKYINNNQTLAHKEKIEDLKTKIKLLKEEIEILKNKEECKNKSF